MAKLSLIVLIGFLGQSVYATDWSNPPVMCPEDNFPKALTCPNLTSVKDPLQDFPAGMSAQEIDTWKNINFADLRVCRHQEILRRSELDPMAFTATQQQISWMMVEGGKEGRLKTEAINQASSKYQIPPQILMGALRQESLLASTGIEADGENYSCGIAQLNIQEWCRAISTFNENTQRALGWPVGLECSGAIIPTNIIKPFYELALKNLGTRPAYKSTYDDYKNITLADVADQLPKGDASLQNARYQAAMSFLKNCRDVKASILAKAHVLRGLFDDYIPQSLKNQSQYSKNESFKKQCRAAYTSPYYPLHTGWLMAVAMYNAGPLQSKIVEHYYQIKDVNNYPLMNPPDLVEALHWGGKYKWFGGDINFKGANGLPYKQTWFKSCIVQRHVARVVQHATIPSASLVKSMEQAPCTPDSTPAYRKKSSGIKDASQVSQF